MLKAGLHALLCSAAGAALAALLSVAWQLGCSLTVHGEPACDFIAVGTVAMVAAVTGHSYSELLERVRGQPADLPRGSAPFQDGEVVARWRKRDGGLLDVWVRSVADRDENGEVVRYRSAALDLTEKTRLADELR